MVNDIRFSEVCEMSSSYEELADILSGLDADGIEADGWLDDDGEFHYADEADEADLIDEAWDSWKDDQI
jgi:hypothetical protein